MANQIEYADDDIANDNAIGYITPAVKVTRRITTLEVHDMVIADLDKAVRSLNTVD